MLFRNEHTTVARSTSSSTRDVFDITICFEDSRPLRPSSAVNWCDQTSYTGRSRAIGGSPTQEQSSISNESMAVFAEMNGRCVSMTTIAVSVEAHLLMESTFNVKIEPRRIPTSSRHSILINDALRQVDPSRFHGDGYNSTRGTWSFPRPGAFRPRLH